MIADRADRADRAEPHAGSLPAIQHAVQFVGPGELVHNRAKPVVAPGRTQILLKVEAVGICFSDTKLLHAFSSHLRKAGLSGGLDPATLAEIPSYVPGELPTVPGHEVAGRIVAIGSDVTRHAVGERVLVQTDYRHLPTPGSNAAFGYNFEGGLQEYVLLDERMIVEPATGERFLIPVDETPGGSAVALLEPWACVEASYASHERGALAPHGRLLVAVDPGHTIDGLGPLLSASPPAAIVVVGADATQLAALRALADAPAAAASGATVGGAPIPVASSDLADLAAHDFDDIVYFGADADRIEALEDLLAAGGVIDIVLGGATIGHPVSVDVGRIHYDLTRWVGTTGHAATDGYAMARPNGELRAGDRVAVIGAAGPMGFMHVIRTIASGRPGIALTAVDIDDDRLAHLATVAGPLAAARGVTAVFLNGRTDPPAPGFDLVAVMVPAPPLVAQAVDLAGPGACVNVFAGFAAGTHAALDLDGVIARRIYLIGTSGSEIADMRTVLARLERGELDTNISVDAISGMEGVRDALAAVEARSSGGKIVVYPQLHELGLVRISELAERYPTVAAALDDGRWTRAAELALLELAAEPAGGSAGGPASRSGASGQGGATQEPGG